MSWSRRRLLSLSLLAALPGGCGWHPLYGNAAGSSSHGASVDRHLAGIAIEPVRWDRNPSPLQQGGEAVFDARTGQILHNALRDGLTPLGPPAEPAYSLSVELGESLDSVIAVENDKTRRERVTLVAHFALADLKGNTVFKDVARAIASYDIFQDPYSDLSARNDARHRLARQLAEAIKTRLATFFATRG